MVEQHTARRQGLLEAKGHESVEETRGSVRREEEEDEEDMRQGTTSRKERERELLVCSNARLSQKNDAEMYRKHEMQSGVNYGAKRECALVVSSTTWEVLVTKSGT